MSTPLHNKAASVRLLTDMLAQAEMDRDKLANALTTLVEAYAGTEDSPAIKRARITLWETEA